MCHTCLHLWPSFQRQWQLVLYQLPASHKNFHISKYHAYILLFLIFQCQILSIDFLVLKIMIYFLIMTFSLYSASQWLKFFVNSISSVYVIVNICSPNWEDIHTHTCVQTPSFWNLPPSPFQWFPLPVFHTGAPISQLLCFPFVIYFYFVVWVRIVLL